MKRKHWFLVFLGFALIYSVGAYSASEPQHEPRLRVFQNFMGGSYLGIVPDEVDSEVADRLQLRQERGALVSKVVEGSPAEEAGLRADDVILYWNQTPVESAIQLRRMINETPKGRSVTLGIYRDGGEMEVQATLGSATDAYFEGDRPESLEWREHWREFGEELSDNLGENLREHIEEWRHWQEDDEDRDRGRYSWLGVSLQSLSPQLAEYFGLGEDTGALISSVVDDSPADLAGFKAGDVITAINGEKVEGPSGASSLIRNHGAGAVDITIMRNGSELTINVELEERRGRRERIFRFSPGDDNERSLRFELPGLPKIRMKNFKLPEIPRMMVFDRLRSKTI